MPAHSIAQVRQLLAAAGLSPQHRFGQNFLIDLNLMGKLVAAAELSPGDVVLEVGPGTGSLTEVLIESAGYVISCEIDRGLAALNRERLSERANFTLVEGDALATKHTLNPEILSVLNEHAPAAGGCVKLVANLPYQIATPLLMNLLHVTPRFERLVCTIQKEVAERLLAAAGTEAYGPLSVTMQTLAKVEWIAKLPPKAFWPRPQVDSAMVKITPLKTAEIPVEDPAAFVDFVQQSFSQRRKMMRRVAKDWPFDFAQGKPFNLAQDKADVIEAVLAEANVPPTDRPEVLTPDHWQRLYAAFRKACPAARRPSP